MQKTATLRKCRLNKGFCTTLNLIFVGAHARVLHNRTFFGAAASTAKEARARGKNNYAPAALQTRSTLLSAFKTSESVPSDSLRRPDADLNQRLRMT
jgi:hypothetical protein